jgi:hypothetical protein
MFLMLVLFIGNLDTTQPYLHLRTLPCRLYLEVRQNSVGWMVEFI